MASKPCNSLAIAGLVLAGTSFALSMHSLLSKNLAKPKGGCCAKKSAGGCSSGSCACGANCSCCDGCKTGGTCTCGAQCKCCAKCCATTKRRVMKNSPEKPYSLAQVHNGTVYVSGQVGLADGKLVDGFAAQARQSMENIKKIVEDAGSSMDKILKMTCYLSDMANYKAFNEIYLEFFPNKDLLPARVCIAASLPLSALVEVECTAAL